MHSRHLNKNILTRRRLTLLVGAIAVLIAVCGAVYFLSTQKGIFFKDSEEGVVKAPNFVLPDALGNMVSLEDIDSEVVVINFWASWSPYAKDELPALVALKKEYGSDITIVGLNRDYNPKEGQAFLESLSLGEDLVFVYDTNDEYYKKVSGYAMPETIFLNEKGDIVAQIHGPATFEQMKEQVSIILQ